MQQFLRTLLLITTVFVTTLAFDNQELVAQSAREVVDQMCTSIDKVNTLDFRFKQKERLRGGKWNIAEIKTKMSVKPKKIFIEMVKPQKAIWLLYVEGERDNKVLINPSRFIPNIKFSTTSSRVMDGQHRPVPHAGFGLINGLIKDGIKRADAQKAFDEIFTLKGTKKYDGQTCDVLTIVDPTFTYEKYTVKSGDDLYKIAKAKNISEYMIFDNNPKMDDYFDLKAGQTIKIPTSFGQKITLYIDQKSHLPLYLRIDDDKGLFEQYEFLDVKINPKFAADTFEK